MRIAAFESPLIVKAAQSVCGGLVLGAFPDGDLEAHQHQNVKSAYVSAEDWSDTCGGYALNTALQDWGVAQIELDYHEDLVLAYQREADATRCFALPVQRYTVPYVSPCPVFETLSALLAYVRCYFTVDAQLYWGKTPQGYVGIALHTLTHGERGPNEAPFIPMFDLHLAQAYSPLSSQLLEAAGTEWALRTLPESVTDVLKDPRPLVTLGAQPYYQQAVSQKLLKTSRWGSTARALKQAEKSTRSVWETFLVPHQQLKGDLQQWQEILYRFLPLYCQWSERLAEYSASLQKKQLLTPYFERSVTPMGRLAQEMESLRGLAQARLVQQAQQSSEASLSPRELLRWPEFARRWQLFLNDYGHCGALDLAQDRMHEQQEQWLSSLLTPWCAGRPLSTLSWPQRLWAGVLWKDYELLYNLREKLCSDTLWALDQVKRRMLPKLNETSVLGAPESSRFAEWCHASLEILTGETEHVAEAASPRDYPQLQVAHSPQTLPTGEVVERLVGTGLKTGLAQGLLWHGQPTVTVLPAGYVPTQTILCLPEIEAVHLPLVQQVAGVILTRGHGLSQGSHLLREWNKPAVVQVEDARDLPEGTPVRLNSDRGVVDVLETL